MPYAIIYKMAQWAVPDATSTNSKGPMIKVKSSLPGVSPKDIALYIDSKAGRIQLVLDGDGVCRLPVSISLIEENPQIISNQPKGSIEAEVYIAAAQRDDAVQDVIEELMGFYEAPSQEKYALIIASHDMILLTCKEHHGSNEVAYDERLMQVFVSFVWKKYGYKGSPYSETMMNQIVDSVLRTKVVSPDDLDALWAAFFATGDVHYLDRLTAEATSDDLIVAGMAKWSIKANCKQRRAVKQYFDQRPEKKDIINLQQKPDGDGKPTP